MSSYQSSTSVNADPHFIFEFIAKPENINRYVPCIESADLGMGDVIHIKGACSHGEFRGVGGFHVDEEHLRLRWDSRANLNYRGWIKVTPAEGHAEVALFLEFDPGMDLSANREFAHLLKEHPVSIQDEMGKALSHIKEICESALAAV
ncbi:MAG TPA: hypothetical protein VMI31_00095 [Fimbriimonadaceae bacterium]|nr:hypothetical protein [Fimbriimonadaceae bacterium]